MFYYAELDKIVTTDWEQIMEIVTSWMEQGIQQGIQREVTLVLRLLNRRFGNLNATLEERVRGLSVDQLENLAEAVLDFSTETDLVNWLNRIG